MSMVLDILSWTLIGVGSVFLFVGAFGLLRLPDFFTRMHAVGVTDTLGIALLLAGLVLQADAFIVGVKLVLIFLFMVITGPTATHALAKAALHGKLAPLLAQKEGGGKSSSS